MKSFLKYCQAHADAADRELAKGSTVTALTPVQAHDAPTAFERLQSLYPLGLFSYDTVGKSQKTVRKFSCNLDAAIRKLALQEQK